MRAVLIAVLSAWLFGSGAAAAMSHQAPPTDPGEIAYQQDCASCHRTPTRFMRRYLDLSRGDRHAALDSFLKTHYAEDDAKRAAIIAWLEANHVRR